VFLEGGEDLFEFGYLLTAEAGVEGGEQLGFEAEFAVFGLELLDDFGDLLVFDFGDLCFVGGFGLIGLIGGVCGFSARGSFCSRFI
jgi:hypothetical protein